MRAPRACQPAEAPDVVRLLNEVFWREEGQEPELLELFPEHYPPADLADHRVVVVEGRVISHVCLIPLVVAVPRGVLNVAVISGVATHRDWRREGLASACMVDALQLADGEGYDLSILATGLRGFYERWGFARVGLRLDYRVTAAVAGQLEGERWGVEACEGRRLATLRRLYQTQHCRVDRTPEQLARCLTARRRWAWLAWDGDRPLAYVVLGSPWGTPRLEHYAGEARAAAALLPHAMRERGWTELILSLPPGDALGQLAADAGAEVSEHRVAMMRVANEPRLLAKLGLPPSAPASPAGGPVGESRLCELFGCPGDGAPALIPFFWWPMDYC